MALTRSAVLAGSKEPNKHYVAQVGHSKANLVVVQGGQLANIVKNGDWKRFDWRVAVKLSVNEEISQGCAYSVAWVQVPHPDEVLTDEAGVVLHRSRSDQLVAGISG